MKYKFSIAFEHLCAMSVVAITIVTLSRQINWGRKWILFIRSFVRCVLWFVERAQRVSNMRCTFNLWYVYLLLARSLSPSLSFVPSFIFTVSLCKCTVHALARIYLPNDGTYSINNNKIERERRTQLRTLLPLLLLLFVQLQLKLTAEEWAEKHK